jgi:hypothetical protein
MVFVWAESIDATVSDITDVQNRERMGKFVILSEAKDLLCEVCSGSTQLVLSTWYQVLSTRY